MNLKNDSKSNKENILHIAGFEKNNYFDQISDQMIISDPSYEYKAEEHTPGSYLLKFNLVLDNVIKGKWRSFLIINDSERDRNAGLVSLNVETNKSNSDLDFINIIKNGDWKKIGNIGVDTGMAGIYDLKYYRDDNIVPYNTKYFTKSKDPGEKWFDMNSNIVIKPTDFAGVIKHGTVTLSGYGDGMYNVYVLRDNKSKIIGVKIIFIEP